MTDIEKLRKLLNLTQETFASKLGVSARTIQNWEAGKVIPKSKLAILHKIASKYPNESFPLFNTSDNLSGKFRNEIEDISAEDAAMISKGLEDGTFKMVPLINIDSVGGIHSENTISASEQYTLRMLPFTEARTGDVAILQSGTSMLPTIPPGSVLLIREVVDWKEYFGYGGLFVLLLKDGRRITKEIRRYDEDAGNYVWCVSYNPEVADEELPKSMIREVWKVIKFQADFGW